MGKKRNILRKTACILLVPMTLALGGCWNNRDITDLAIVTGIGIDLLPDGNFSLTAQVVGQGSASAGAQTGSSGTQEGGAGISVTAEGATIFDATRNLIPKLSKKAYYSHIQLMLVGEAAAKKGFGEFWDFYERDHEVNRTFRIVVVKSGMAKEVLTAAANVGNIGSVEITDTLDNKAYGKLVNIRAYKVSETLAEPLTGMVTGVVVPNHASKLTEMRVEGGAIFKKGRLAGYLDTDQTRGYLFAMNQMESTVLTVKNPKEPGKLVSIEVVSSAGRLTAGMEGERPQLGVEITAAGNIGDEQGSADLTDELSIQTLESEAERLIAENIGNMLEVSQKTYDSDLLDFNDLLYKHDYGAFKKIQSNWDSVYRDAVIAVHVKFTLERSGIVQKPAYGGD